MNNISVQILNPEAIEAASKMMVCAARLTQSGHKIKDLEDFNTIYNQSVSEKTRTNMINLPHPTIQKFGVINVVIVGASRRFLAQVTRHQNEVKFMSASLQYSDYSSSAAFAVPYDILKADMTKEYLASCKNAMAEYESLIQLGVSHDDAAYVMPHGLRNVLIVSATPYQWKHMIGQRTCRRNSDETRIVMLKIWQELFMRDPVMFSLKTTGPFCLKGECLEHSFGCGNPITGAITPADIFLADYPLLR